ncbi:MAG TPA: GNAT family N-acetyltransferase [Rickettsia endosymbiont of Pyrocoelia pectoralis]|nr:GNAT family N-acetyltransferase [Rickettsia endosymbiont of Pyrocoelia pectoralis]
MNDKKNLISLNNDAELINKNLIGIYRYFDIQKTQIAGANYYLLNTGYNYFLLNMIVLPNSVSSEAINEMEQVFKSQNLPFAWWVEEKNLSKHMINHFESRDYNYIDDVSGMIFELNSYQEKSFDIGDIVIKPINSLEEFKKWIDVLIICFGDEEINSLYINKLSEFLGNDNIFIPLAAYDDNKIVATSSIIFADNIAGFCNDATLPEYRNRRIASSLYHARFKILKKMQVPKVVIHTSSMTTSLAQKLGFQKVVNYKIYSQTV